MRDKGDAAAQMRGCDLLKGRDSAHRSIRDALATGEPQVRIKMSGGTGEALSETGANPGQELRVIMFEVRVAGTV